MRKHLILIVDDEPAILRLTRARLEADGHAVATAGSGEEALKLIESERPDLVLLDLMMPGIDGHETLRRVRQTSQVPVIMLTARGSDSDKLKGFNTGADDYITKPFNPDELSARVRALLRRTAGTAPAGRASLHYESVEIDLEKRTVHAGGEEVRLSRTEWELLSQLAANAGKVMLHGELLSRIWGPEFRDEVHYLRTWVSRIRAKLHPNGESGEGIIETYPGIGYRMRTPDDAGE